MSSVKEDRIAAALTTVKASALRATFVAGFAYYELGRYDFAKFRPEEVYVGAMTFAFTVSVISATLSSYVTYYMDRAETVAAKHAFFKKTKLLTVAAFVTFILSLLLHGIAISKSGWLYYRDSDTRFIAPVFGALFGVSSLASLAFIVKAHVSMRATGFDPERSVEEAALKALTRGPGQAVFLGQVGKNELYDYVLRQALTINNRATYVVGFSQACVTRYLTTGSSLGTFYVVFACASTYCALFVALNLTVAVQFLLFQPRRLRNAAAAKAMPVFRACFLCFFLGFFFLCLSVAFMGWGCGYPKSDAFITLAFGLAGFLFLVLIVVKNQSTAKNVRTEWEDGDVLPGKDDDYEISKLKGLTNSTGNQAMISSGFVFYNIITYKTDVLLASEEGNFSPQQIFLIINTLTIVTGLASAFIDSTLMLGFGAFNSNEQRAEYARRMNSTARLCGTLFEISLVGFMCGFGWYPPTKFPKPRWSPVIGACFGIVLMFGAKLFIQLTYMKARKSGEDTADKNTDATNETVNNAVSQWSRIGFTALFFGGFAYFSVVFFNRQEDRTLPYIRSCSMSFVSSIVLVTWATYVNSYQHTLRSDALKLEFMRGLNAMYVFGQLLMLLAMATFIFAFSSIGYVKSDFNIDRYSPIMTVAGGITFLLVTAAIIVITLQYRKSLNANTANLKLSTFPYERLASQLSISAGQASFTAGNVFFEVIFAVSGPNDFANYWYFVNCSITLGLGCVVVTIANLINLRLSDLPTRDKRIHFMMKMRLFKGVAFVLQTVSTFTWVVSVVAAGTVKYPRWWYWSFYSGIVGSTSVIVLFVITKLASNSVLKLNLEDEIFSGADDAVAADENAML